MITLRLKTAMIMSLVLCSGMVVAGGRKNRGGCANGTCAKQVRFAPAPMQQGAQYSGRCTTGTCAKQAGSTKQQPVQQDETAKALAASKAQFEQEQQQKEAQAMAESAKSAEQEELFELQMQHAIAETMTQKVSNTSKNTPLKERVKNWFATKWENTKTYAALAKDFVAEKTAKGWAKTKNGCQRGWIRTKLAFKKLWNKITPKKYDNVSDAYLASNAGQE